MERVNLDVKTVVKVCIDFKRATDWNSSKLISGICWAPIDGSPVSRYSFWRIIP